MSFSHKREKGRFYQPWNRTLLPLILLHNVENYTALSCQISFAIDSIFYVQQWDDLWHLKRTQFSCVMDETLAQLRARYRCGDVCGNNYVQSSWNVLFAQFIQDTTNLSRNIHGGAFLSADNFFQWEVRVICLNLVEWIDRLFAASERVETHAAPNYLHFPHFLQFEEHLALNSGEVVWPAQGLLIHSLPPSRRQTKGRTVPHCCGALPVVERVSRHQTISAAAVLPAVGSVAIFLSSTSKTPFLHRLQILIMASF